MHLHCKGNQSVDTPPIKFFNGHTRVYKKYEKIASCSSFGGINNFSLKVRTISWNELNYYKATYMYMYVHKQLYSFNEVWKKKHLIMFQNGNQTTDIVAIIVFGHKHWTLILDELKFGNLS